MSIRKFLCGSSSEVFNALSGSREDSDGVRLLTRLNLARSTPVAAEFRVIAMRAGGREVLCGLARTRAEAEERRQAAAKRFRTVRVQRWVGTARCGCWSSLGE
jgi:hypothetical protein